MTTVNSNGGAPVAPENHTPTPEKRPNNVRILRTQPTLDHCALLRQATQSELDATEKELDRLRASVEEMDRLSHDGFSQISGIAQLALAAMKGPDSQHYQDAIAEALRAIQGKAEDIQNCMNCVAEAVGSNYVDPPTDESRSEARRVWLATDMEVSA